MTNRSGAGFCKTVLVWIAFLMILGIAACTPPSQPSLDPAAENRFIPPQTAGSEARQVPVREIAKPFRFVVLGDSRGGADAINEQTLRRLLGQVKELQAQPAFILFTGDMIKGGAVEVELNQWKEVISEYYPMSLVYRPLGITSGTRQHSPRCSRICLPISLKDMGEPLISSIMSKSVSSSSIRFAKMCKATM